MATALGAGGWLVAAGLLSFLGTIWIASGIWIAIAAAVVFVLFAKGTSPQLQVISVLAASAAMVVATLLIPQSIDLDSLFTSGIWGWVTVAILAIFAAAMTFFLTVLVQKIAA